MRKKAKTLLLCLFLTLLALGALPQLPSAYAEDLNVPEVTATAETETHEEELLTESDAPQEELEKEEEASKDNEEKLQSEGEQQIADPDEVQEDGEIDSQEEPAEEEEEPTEETRKRKAAAKAAAETTVTYTGTSSSVSITDDSAFNSDNNARMRMNNALSKYLTLTKTTTTGGKSTSESYVAYCFNENKGWPINTNYPVSMKYENATNAQFVSMASNRYYSAWNRFYESNFKPAVLWCVYYGYPYNQPLQQDGITNFLQLAKNYGYTTDQEAMYALRKATQYAIWYFTDTDTVLHNMASRDWTTPGDNLNGMTWEYSRVYYLARAIAHYAYWASGSSPKINGQELELDLYGTDEQVLYTEQMTDAQNLLVVRLPEGSTPGTTEPPEVPDVPEPQDTTKTLSLQKNISGSFADPTEAFTFTITLTDKDGKALTGTYEVTGTVRTGSSATAPTITSLTFDSNGQATVNLTDGQGITIKGLPSGYSYTIQESETTGYQAEITATGNNQIADSDRKVAGESIDADETEISYLNRMNDIVRTGIGLDMRPLLLVLVLGAILGAGFLIHMNFNRRTRHRRDGNA